MADACIVFITFPSDETARALGRTLVEEQLAACVNVTTPVQSIYRWQGAVHEEREVLCIVKTTQDRFDALKARVLALHTYEVPEIIALPIVDGHAAYLEWVASSVGRK